MKKIKVIVDGVPTHIRKLNYIKAGGDDICPLCRKKIKQGEAYLLINNYKLFPNVVIHDWCVVRIIILNYSPKKDWKSTIKELKEDYQRAEETRKHNICWFGKFD
jgi:hypothetical protein